MQVMTGIVFAVYVVAVLLGSAMHLLVVKRLKRKHRESWMEVGSPRYFSVVPETKYREWRQHGVHKRLGDARLSSMVSIGNICVVVVLIMTLCAAVYGIVGSFQKYQ